MVLLKVLITYLNKAKYKEENIEEIVQQTFYDDTNGKLIIVYNEQFIQDSLIKEKINEISINIRAIIKNHVKYNLWNTYLLVLVDKNPFNEKYYYIERDVRNLRKYVIQNENDILRIPFLNIAENKIDYEEASLQTYSPSAEIQDLYNNLRDKDGYRKKLSKARIIESLKELSILGENDD